MSASAIVASALNILKTAPVADINFFLNNGAGNITGTPTPQQQQQLAPFFSSQETRLMMMSISQEIGKVVSTMSPDKLSQIPYTKGGVTGTNIQGPLISLSNYIYNSPKFKSIGITFPAQFDKLFSASGASAPTAAPTKVTAPTAAAPTAAAPTAAAPTATLATYKYEGMYPKGTIVSYASMKFLAKRDVQPYRASPPVGDAKDPDWSKITSGGRKSRRSRRSRRYRH